MAGHYSGCAGGGPVTFTLEPLPAEKRVMPMVLQWESWQARLVRKLEIAHALGKPAIYVVRLGDCPVHWFKTVSEK